MITLDHVSKQYKSSARPALDNVSVKIDKGEFVFLIGPSGSGKSTFMRLLLAEESPTNGDVRVSKFHVNKLPGRHIPSLRQVIGCVFQDFRLLQQKTVFENVAFALEVIGKRPDVINRVVPDVLEMVGLSGKANRLPGELSGGEQQRVAIARAFVNRPLVLLADEPTGNLDPETSKDIMDLLERINRTGTTVLMATHDHHIVDSMRQRVVELEPGPAGPRRAARHLRNGSLVRFGFLVNEVWTGLRRNVTMTIAMILTTAISIGLFGGGLLVVRLADNRRAIYLDRVESQVFLTNDVSANDPTCDADPCKALRAQIEGRDDVRPFAS